MYSVMKTNYTVSTDSDGQLSDHVTLNEALKAMPKAHGANVLGPKGDRRLVAFFDGHTGTIRPGFGATDIERAEIIADAGLFTV